MIKILQSGLAKKSEFLNFFLSCTNSKKFYDRRDLEFNDSWVKDMKNKISTMLDDPITSLQDQNTKKVTGADQLSDDQRRHIFLEDVTHYARVNRRIHRELPEELTQLIFYLEQVANKLATIGNLFEKLTATHKEIELHKVAAVFEIQPANSKLYSDLKSTFFKWNNSMVTMKSELKRIFEPRIGNILTREDTVVEKLKLRNGIAGGLNSKDEAIIADEQEKKMNPDERRDYRLGKLFSSNKLIYGEVADMLMLESQDMSRCRRELADFNLKALEREKSMWIDIMEKDKVSDK